MGAIAEAVPIATEMRTGRQSATPRRVVWQLCCALLGSGLAACSQSTSSPQATAQAFVDRFFVEADERAALPLTEGVARAKLEEGLRLLGDQPASTTDERPRVYYRQLSAQTQDDGMAFHFRLTVVVLGDQPVEPELIVRVRPSGDQWRVSNFEVLPPRALAPET
jgi:hypothetical protein